MGKLKLTVNEEETRVCKVPEGEYDFLGETFGRMYSARTGQAWLGRRPSRMSIRRQNGYRFRCGRQFFPFSGGTTGAVPFVGSIDVNDKAIEPHFPLSVPV